MTAVRQGRESLVIILRPVGT